MVKLSNITIPYSPALPALVLAIFSCAVVLLLWDTPQTRLMYLGITLGYAWTEQELSWLTAWDWAEKGWEAHMEKKTPQWQFPLASSYPSSDKASQGTSYGFHKIHSQFKRQSLIMGWIASLWTVFLVMLLVPATNNSQQHGLQMLTAEIRLVNPSQKDSWQNCLA